MPADVGRAEALYRRSAEAGNPAAARALGDLYSGVTVRGRQEMAKAIGWYERAAGQGEAWAQFRLAQLYMTGEGVTQDPGKALRLYQEAAAGGEPMAQRALGDLYANGTLVERDPGEAARWYRAAALQAEAARR